MRKIFFPLVAGVLAVLATSCAGPDRKLARGLSNTFELVRWGEMRKSVEESTIMPQPGYGYYGFVHGFHRSLGRASLGLFEVATFPLPSYNPILTNSFAPDPVYPESYKPGLVNDPLFHTDTYSGFSGGDIAPFIPGSRFQVFDN